MESRSPSPARSLHPSLSVISLAAREGAGVPMGRLVGIAAVPPEAPDRSRKHEGTLPITGVARVAEGLADVVLLDSQAAIPLALVRSRQPWLGFLRKREEEIEVPIA